MFLTIDEEVKTNAILNNNLRIPEQGQILGYVENNNTELINFINTFKLDNFLLPEQIENDFNGDGKSDIISIGNDGSVKVALATEDGYDYWTYSHEQRMIARNVKDILFDDVNGDGRADLVAYANNTNGDWGLGSVVVALSVGEGTSFEGFDFWTYIHEGKIIADNAKDVMLADVNGDGRADLVGYANNSTADWGIGSVVVALSVGEGSTFEGFDFWTYIHKGKIIADNAKDVMLVDVNGDGRDDLVGFANDTNADWAKNGVNVALSLSSESTFIGFDFWTHMNIIE